MRALWLERVASRSKRLDNGCIVSDYSPKSDGYVRIKVLGLWKALHRLSYAHFNGVLEDHELVRHTCDNPLCWNPDHLVKGSHQDNSNDMVERDRHAHGDRHVQAKLSNEQAQKIVASQLSCRKLAKAYGVSPITISRVKRGERYEGGSVAI